MSYVPTTYEEWKHCITVKCEIRLTAAYVRERIASLSDEQDFHTQRFVDRWGAAHHARTLEWFHEAAAELSTDQ
ncbi:MAG: hypothetical protein AAF631_05655 [Pseudomonadota bacterium]